MLFVVYVEKLVNNYLVLMYKHRLFCNEYQSFHDEILINEGLRKEKPTISLAPVHFVTESEPQRV